MNNDLVINDTITELKERVERKLSEFLPNAQSLPLPLHQAMSYALLNGGKRIRPLLVYLTGNMLGAEQKQLDYPACAIEMIHTYSLVHDDLPAMDDDDLRRNKPTVHKAFDEATAILVGDALQTLAFEILSTTPFQSTHQLAMINTLAKASGSLGMAGGQALDLHAAQHNISLEELTQLYQMKTGALIDAAIKLGAIAADCTNTEQLTHLEKFATNIGLAFQIQDDILDIESSTDVLGKPQGSDQARNQPTYPKLAGHDKAKNKLIKLHHNAINELKIFEDRANPLILLTNSLMRRQH